MPVHLETHEIRVFKTVYEENGFNRAAEKLFVTQSAVSQTIANLEHKLDTLLFHRKPLKLTEAGTRLMQYAQTVLSEEETVLSDLKNIKNGILSTLHLTMNSTVNALFGADLIRAFCNKHPLTRLKISIQPSRRMITSVSSELWELGLGPFQQTMPERFRTIPLFDETRHLVIHPSCVKPNASAEQLLHDVPLIISHLDDPDLRPTIDKLRDNFGTIWEIDALSLRLALVHQGLGMTYLDNGVLQQHPELTLLDRFAFSTIPLTYGIYYRRDKMLSAGAAQFIKMCESFSFDTDTA
jgi:DNA-binding transcriptional LysR family regulator